MALGRPKELLIAIAAFACASACAPGAPPTPTASAEVVRPLQLTGDARIMDSDSAIADVEVFSDRLVVRYSAAPDLEPAAGNVLVGSHGGGYLRRVKWVTTQTDGALEIFTEAAALTDLIRDGHFRLTHATEGDAWASGDGALGKAQFRLSGGVQVLPPGERPCGLTVAGSELSYEPVFDFSLAPEIEIDVRPDPTGPRGSLHKALFAAVGKLNIGANVKATGAAGATCSVDLIDALRDERGNPNLLKWRLPPTTLMVGLVPIVVAHTIEPVFAINLDGQVTQKGQTTLSSVADISLRVGGEYFDGAWHEIWQPTTSGTISSSVPQELESLSISSALSGGVQYSSFLWDLVGPTIHVDAGVGTRISYDGATCTWIATAASQLGAGVGGQVQIPIIEQVIAGFSLSPEPLEWPLGSRSERLQCEQDDDAVAGNGGSGGDPDPLLDGTLPPANGGGNSMPDPAPDASADPYRPDDSGACPFPLQPCGGTCVDGASNPQHCGACGSTCGAGESCVNGYCGHCTVDDDCAAVTWGSGTSVSEMSRRCAPSGLCVGCLTDTDCLGELLCIGAQCGYCRSDSDCTSGSPYCGPFRNLEWMNYEQANAFANSYCMSCIAGDASRDCVGTTEPNRLHCLAPEVNGATGQPYFTNICTSCTTDEHCQAHIAATTGYVPIGPKCIIETPTRSDGNSCGCLTDEDCLAQWGGTARCREPGSYCIGCDASSPAGACRR